MSVLDVCIIGGGIGGLSAAISLQKIGCKVKVFERDDDFVDRKQGYGLTLTNNNKGPLAQLGVLDECIQQNCLSNSHYVFNEVGNVLGYYGRTLKTELNSNSNGASSDSTNSPVNNIRGNLRIPRQDLRQMMMDKLLLDSVVWSRKLIQYTEHRTHVAVEFEYKQADGRVQREIVECKVLVGADGVRSAVRRLRDEKENISHLAPLNYLKTAVIIGLSTIDHPLLNSRGFYVLDGTHRMFTMPFTKDPPTADALSSSYKRNNSSSLTMWQLSFSGLTESEALCLRSLSFDDLIAEALRRTASWFAPVQEMIRSTATGEAWGTPLYDRDAMTLKGKQHVGSRVTVIGDACHPMAMFKGQGANQALDDGPLLAHWLGSRRDEVGKRKRSFVPTGEINKPTGVDSVVSNNDSIESGDVSSKPQNIFADTSFGDDVVFTRLKCFEREMVARTASKVQGSREAAHHLHSLAALEEMYGIEGVRPEDVKEHSLLQRLRDAQVSAALAGDLDGKMKDVLKHYVHN
jgi:2-polyprenyl-6-methoxyphenol hydroxylase-like FAD-dependent oxidoreductase